MYFDSVAFRKDLIEKVGPLPDASVILDYIKNEHTYVAPVERTVIKEEIETDKETVTVTITKKNDNDAARALISDPLRSLKDLPFETVFWLIQTASRQKPEDHDSPHIYPIYPRPLANYINYENVYEIHPDLYKPEIPIIVWKLSLLPSNYTYGRKIKIDSDQAVALRKNKIGDMVWNDILQESKPYHTDLAKYLLIGDGSYFLSPTNDPNEWAVNLDYLSAYEVHAGFYRYGGVMYLRDGDINRIVYDGVTYDTKHSEYPRIEYIFRASLCMKIVVELHAVFCHLIVANPTAIDLVQHQDGSTYAYSEKLRNFLRITTTRTLEINAAVPILAITSGSILSRMFATTPAGHLQYIKDCYANLPKIDEPLKMESFILGKPNTPWRQKAQKYYDTMQNYIRAEIFDNLTDPDISKIKKYTNHFFVSTIFHEILGDRALFDIVVTGYLPTRVRIDDWKLDDEVICDIVATAALAVSTRIPKHNSPKIREIIPNFWKPSDDLVNDAAFLEVAVGY